MPATVIANLVQLRTGRKIRIDDSSRAIALVQEEIFRSGRSYAALADKAGCGHATVAKIALGETKRPAHATVVRILVALGWSVCAEEDN